jgi:hypothetical protein
MAGHEPSSLRTLCISKKKKRTTALRMLRQNNRLRNESWSVEQGGLLCCDLPEALWESLSADYRKRCIFYTDEYFIYQQVLSATRHLPPAGCAGSR